MVPFFLIAGKMSFDVSNMQKGNLSKWDFETSPLEIKRTHEQK